MIEYKFNVAMDVRAYGVAYVKAESPEAAKEALTAEIVADTFTPHGGSGDIDYQHPSDIYSDGMWETDDGEGELVDFGVDDGPWIMQTETPKIDAGSVVVGRDVLNELIMAAREAVEERDNEMQHTDDPEILEASDKAGKEYAKAINAAFKAMDDEDKQKGQTVTLTCSVEDFQRLNDIARYALTCDAIDANEDKMLARIIESAKGNTDA